MKKLWIILLGAGFFSGAFGFVFTLSAVSPGEVAGLVNRVNWGTNCYNPAEWSGDQYDGVPGDASPAWIARRSNSPSSAVVRGDYLRITTTAAGRLEFAQTSNFDLTKDTTIEVVFRVVSQSDPTAAGILTFGQSAGTMEGVRSFLWIGTNSVSTVGASSGAVDLTQWTTMRITFENISDSGSRMVKLYFNNNSVPVIENVFPWYSLITTTDGLGFGDVSVNNTGGIIDYKSIRWTSEGAFTPLSESLLADLNVSTTIDFFDFAWTHTDPMVGYYTEDQYEEVFKSLAVAGFSKVYIRVNAVGYTLYPTATGSIYSGDGREPGSSYLTATLAQYDPLEKTIEFGHKYGLSVWAWDNLFDDVATFVRYPPGSPNYESYGEFPLMDPYLAANTDLLWALDPRIATTNVFPENAGSITKIRITSAMHVAPRINPATLQLWVATNEWNYTRYYGGECSSFVSNSVGVVQFEDLNIASPYNNVKVYCTSTFPVDNSYTMVGTGDSFVEAYFDGAWHYVPSGFTIISNPAEGNVEYKENLFAWDYGNRTLGFSKFKQLRPWYGMMELTEETARAYKLAKFAELTAYDFDGFSFSLRTHTQADNADQYGYNQSVRDLYLAQYGVDIWQEPFDLGQWIDIRAGGVNTFLLEARALTGTRPLYVDTFPSTSNWATRYGGLPFQMEQWMSEDGWVAGGMDAIRLLDYGVQEYPEVDPHSLGEVNVSRFIDNRVYFNQYGQLTAAGLVEFENSLPLWFQDDSLDEVEFYETLFYVNYPETLEALRKAFHDEAVRQAAE